MQQLPLRSGFVTGRTFILLGEGVGGGRGRVSPVSFRCPIITQDELLPFGHSLPLHDSHDCSVFSQLVFIQSPHVFHSRGPFMFASGVSLILDEASLNTAVHTGVFFITLFGYFCRRNTGLPGDSARPRRRGTLSGWLARSWRGCQPPALSTRPSHSVPLRVSFPQLSGASPLQGLAEVF